MCGIVGYIGPRDSVPILIEGLHRLEYRGYDSAGVGVITPSGLKVQKATGTVQVLERSLPKRLKGSPGIGHTRWATHGEPSEANAHPHVDSSGRIAVVHNGVIENAAVLRAKLEADGVELRSATDTEVLAHLIASHGECALAEAVRRTLIVTEGTYGLAVLSADEPDLIVAARNGSPLVLGIGQREMFVASDTSAIVRHTTQVVHLDDGEIAVVRADGFATSTLEAEQVEKATSRVEATAEDYDRGIYAHFMRKEIAEQPAAVERALQGRVEHRFATSHLGGLNLSVRDARAVERVKILGCGSAYYAGTLGAQLVEELARIPSDAEPASEFRYRNPVVEPGTLYVAVSQSGETYDTLRAVQEVQRKGGTVLGVVNVVGSSIARQCDGGIYLHAGSEVSVTSTKTFTSTAVAFALLALHLGRIRDLSPADGRRISEGLERLPLQIEEIIAAEALHVAVAEELVRHSGALYIGRVRGYPIAREGAQKLKEVSYLHAEAYPTSELKHGPLALVGPDLPTVAIIPDDELVEKNLTALEEIRARQGQVIAVTQVEIPDELADFRIEVPTTERELSPILLGIPLQLLAYHAAVLLGHNVDRPRNLAKSVTVE